VGKLLIEVVRHEGSSEGQKEGSPRAAWCEQPIPPRRTYQVPKQASISRESSPPHSHLSKDFNILASRGEGKTHSVLQIRGPHPSVISIGQLLMHSLTDKIITGRKELRQNWQSPATFPHNGLHERCDALEHRQRAIGMRAVFEMGERFDPDVRHVKDRGAVAPAKRT
jgi:hypothetical protein